MKRHAMKGGASLALAFSVFAVKPHVVFFPCDSRLRKTLWGFTVHGSTLLDKLANLQSDGERA